MQSYEHHIVHESLEMRHPYIQDPFSSDIDPTQITTAVFDRMISKFREVLLNEELEPDRLRDALKTLNEQVHHQETADMMIGQDQEVLQIAAELLKHEDPEVREQAALLQGSFAISGIGRQIFDYAFENLKELLEDEDLRCREASAWALYRLSVNEDGCQRMVQAGIPEFMIMSFITHSEPKELQYADAQYLIHLLEAFVNITFSDTGIETLLGRDAIKQFNKIIGEDFAQEKLQDRFPKIAELCLRVIGNMSINHTGKEECIEHKIIATSFVYLAAVGERSYEDALNTSLILMSTSIHLEGKNQIVDQIDEEQNPVIIQTIISRLEDRAFPDLRNNLKVALTNVAELPRGFEEITRQLLQKIAILDEVFGARAVKPLHNFLPKLSEYDSMLEQCPKLLSDWAPWSQVIDALAFLFQKYKEEAAQVAVDETINFSEKLAPFINPKYGVQNKVFICLAEILSIDAYNCHVMQKFILKYGELPVNNRTFKHEMFQECHEIFELAMEARILT